jgi:hypothetical protein
MNNFQRILVIALLGSFPVAAYLLGTSPKGKDLVIAQSVKARFTDVGTSDASLKELNHVIDSKAREIQGLEVKILENQGNILRLEEEKKTVLKDLEAFQGRLTTIIHDIKKDDMAHQR